MTRLLRHFTAAAATVLTLALCACSSDQPGDSEPATGGAGGAAVATGAEGGTLPSEVEIFSWWTDGGEQEALDDLLALHAETYPGASVINRAIEYAEEARNQLQTRMAQGNPPDSFQANLGVDLLQWVGPTSARTLLEPLDELAEDQDWRAAFPDELMAVTSRDDVLYGVPLNVHRINSLFYDKRLFTALELTPPTTLTELRALCRTLRDDHGTVPLALGNQWNWTLSQLTFEMVLPAVAGPDYYLDFLSGRASPTDPQIVETLAEVLWLRCGDEPTSACDGYFNANTDTTTWAEAVHQLVTGGVAMAPMGDWAKGYLESQGLEADVDFGVVPFPGTEGIFVYTADTFDLPRGAANAEGARRLLTTFGSEAGQVVFNAAKGSLPARTIELADYPDQFDSMHLQTAADWDSATRVLAFSGLLSGHILHDLGARLKQSMQAGTIDITLVYLEANYSNLQQ